MSGLFGNHIVGFPTRRLIYLTQCRFIFTELKDMMKVLIILILVVAPLSFAIPKSCVPPTRTYSNESECSFYCPI